MKKVEVRVERAYSKEFTKLVDVPTNLVGNEIREYLIDKYDGSHLLHEEFSRVDLECDGTILQDVIEVEQEFKIKWEIELTANSPEQAARLALEMIQSKDSSAKVFNIDGVNIDLYDEDEEEVGKNTLTFVPMPHEPSINLDEEVLVEEYVNSKTKPFGFEATNTDKNFTEHNHMEFKCFGYRLLIFNDRHRWDSEEFEDVEIHRGEIENYYYILDKLTS
jgi:hypothetical protein